MIDRFTDHAANERTFLAWVRTVIAIVGFGLGAGRIGAQTAPPWSDLAMLLVGALVIALAFLRMRHVRRRIAEPSAIEDDSLPADSLLLLLVAALFALLATFAVHLS